MNDLTESPNDADAPAGTPPIPPPEQPNEQPNEQPDEQPDAPSSGRRRVPCPVCQASVVRQGLKKHLESNHGFRVGMLRRTDYNCALCDYRGVPGAPGPISRHMFESHNLTNWTVYNRLIESGGRPTVTAPAPARSSRQQATCPECGKEFHGAASHARLGAHRRAMHGIAGTAAQRPVGRPPTRAGSLRCPECGEGFSNPQGLGRHRQMAHGIAGTSPTSISARRKHQQRRPRVGHLVIPPPRNGTMPAQVPLFDIAETAPPPSEKQVCFCPICGTNIQLVRAVVNYRPA